ncbi:hypothetical protein K4F52_007024 [Lecanicillium sp. MT-2017a]|nr:hypothetical protein K4F52_007024 [Lecanicillium sp. MT-2017a]
MPAIPSLDEKPEKPTEADASYTTLSANQEDGSLECSSQTIDDLNSRISIQPSSLPETRLRSPVHALRKGKAVQHRTSRWIQRDTRQALIPKTHREVSPKTVQRE